VIDANPQRVAQLQARYAADRERVRIHCQDLNFVVLPAGEYDAVIAASGMFRVINLEYVLDEIARALRPGGLAALIAYIGERRQAYAPERIALVNAALADVPVRFRYDGERPIAAPDPESIAPFRAIRSDEILPLAKARFDVVEEHVGGRLFPLSVYIDVPALEREAPEVLDRLLDRERALAADPAATACTAYLVLRKRAGTGGERQKEFTTEGAEDREA
jgi:SAM-dependent methyltransferase